MLRQMRDSMLRQTMHVCVASDTQEIRVVDTSVIHLSRVNLFGASLFYGHFLYKINVKYVFMPY